MTGGPELDWPGSPEKMAGLQATGGPHLWR